jgi:hypothetical protein
MNGAEGEGGGGTLVAHRTGRDGVGSLGRRVATGVR